MPDPHRSTQLPCCSAVPLNLSWLLAPLCLTRCRDRCGDLLLLVSVRIVAIGSRQVYCSGNERMPPLRKAAFPAAWNLMITGTTKISFELAYLSRHSSCTLIPVYHASHLAPAMYDFAYFVLDASASRTRSCVNGACRKRAPD